MKLSHSLILFALLLFTAIPSVHAAPVDYSSWNAVNLGNTDGTWIVDSATVKQTRNSDSTIFLSDTSYRGYEATGSFGVHTTSDDDFIGFIFGYQDSGHFYLFDWKQKSQSYGSGTAQRGFAIKKFSADSSSDFALNDFWSSEDTDYSTVLASNNTLGWADNQDYGFELDFGSDGFSIQIVDGSSVLWDVTVADTSYQEGQFGFYNTSQEQSYYSNFDIIPVTAPVPEPSTIFLLGSGLAGLAFCRRKRK